MSQLPLSPAPPFAAKRAFLVLAGGFLLLYALVLASAWRQSGQRTDLETVVSLSLPEPPPTAPAETPTEP